MFKLKPQVFNSPSFDFKAQSRNVGYILNWFACNQSYIDEKLFFAIPLHEVGHNHYLEITAQCLGYKTYAAFKTARPNLQITSEDLERPSLFAHVSPQSLVYDTLCTYFMYVKRCVANPDLEVPLIPREPTPLLYKFMLSLGSDDREYLFENLAFMNLAGSRVFYQGNTFDDAFYALSANTEIIAIM
ncbi:hypothetical protein [Acinetobacter sp. P1(2025)]|uniref:hypothetical protein n=1 Tax=Acinetobacter sp. P1(2025) TaxID=3446120 RepID=UPI003F537CA0